MINIRLATQEDLQDLQALNKELFADNDKYDTDLDLTWPDTRGQEYFSELLSDSSSLCLIAEDDSKKIGYLAAGPKKLDFCKSKWSEVYNMVVIPEYRSQGVGKLLMEKYFEWAKEKGYEKAFVNSYFHNKRAVDFYKNSGFTEIDISLEKTL